MGDIDMAYTEYFFLNLEKIEHNQTRINRLAGRTADSIFIDQATNAMP